MNEIRIMQVGIGPLGIKINQFIDERESMKTVAAVDINPKLNGADLGKLCQGKESGIIIEKDYSKINTTDIDVAILTTSSSLASIEPQIKQIIELGIPVVSTCEELSYPWENDKTISTRIDDAARQSNVSVVGTGVNPGFLMDTLPSMLTSVSQKVDYVLVNRIQDARTRRVPFQKKIGAGLSLSDFQKKVSDGSLRHVGLTESMQFIASALGWEVDETEDIISPIVATQNITTPSMNIAKGDAMGVRQIGRASYKGKEKIKLVFEAAVGSGSSYDEIKIQGEPNISSRIDGGVNGDIATCAIALNVIPSLLKSNPGLKTMRDLSLVSYRS